MPMNTGDDISNLLRGIGNDVGVYQDLSLYNASRSRMRHRLSLSRSTAMAPSSTPATPSLTASQRVTSDEATALTTILQRLAGTDEPAAAAPPADSTTSVPPLSPAHGARLDLLFDRLDR